MTIATSAPRCLAAAAGVALIASCQAVAGIESRTLDPPPPGPGEGCAIATDGPARVRFANLVPSDDRVDVCIRAAGASSYGRPIFRNGGADCGSLAYGDVTAPLGAPATSVDVKIVPAGQTCAAAPLSEALGVTLAPDAVSSVLRIGGGGVPEQIVALSEEPAVDAVKLRVRVVHAAPGLKPLVVGITAASQLPTDVSSPLLTMPVEFGHAAPSGTKATLGTLDDRGYIASIPSAYELGVAEVGTTRALLHTTTSGRAGTSTVYAIGSIASSNKYPVRGLVCDESSPVNGKASCTLTKLPTLSVTAFNVGLFGPNASFEDQRRPRLVDAIKSSDADFMCLYETARKEDRALFAAAYPNAYAPDLDLTTPFSDPRDQMGQTPPAPTKPPCGDAPTSDLDALFTCMETNCSTAPPGDPSGRLPGTTDCLSRKCAAPFLPILNDHQACFACLADHLESQNQYGNTRNACTTDVRQPFAFDGQNPSMLLSRYPLTNQEVFVLPSTNFRRAVLYAQATLEDQTVDVFCGFLSSTLIYASIPYTGQYGGGADPATDAAYNAEALLQADKTIAWVKQKTDASKRPAILVGDWHASVQFDVMDSMGGKTTVVDPLHPETVNKFRQAFTRVNAPGWVPRCSDCPASINRYNGDVTTKWLFYDMYVVNWPPNAATEQSIVFDKPVVPLPDGTTGMLSLYFAMNAKLLRPQ